MVTAPTVQTARPVIQTDASVPRRFASARARCPELVKAPPEELHGQYEAMAERVEELERELATARESLSARSRPDSGRPDSNGEPADGHGNGCAKDEGAASSEQDSISDRGHTTERQRWRSWLKEFETTIARGVEMAVGDPDVPETVGRQRLTALSNALKQGMIYVGQASLDQEVQGLRQSGSTQTLAKLPE